MPVPRDPCARFVPGFVPSARPVGTAFRRRASRRALTRASRCVFDRSSTRVAEQPQVSAYTPQTMRYAEYPPSPALAALVDCYWIREGNGCGVPEPIIPDGRVEIVLHYGVRFERHHPDGRIERQDAAVVVGQRLAPISIAHRGGAGVAAIRLRPEAARAVTGCDATAITGSFVDLEALCGAIRSIRRAIAVHAGREAPVRSRGEQLALPADDAARVRLLERWLAPRLRTAPSRQVAATVAAIKAQAGMVDLASLAAAGGGGRG